MTSHEVKKRIRLSLFLITVLIFSLVTIGVGRTQARYEATLTEELTFEYQGDQGAIYLLSSEKDENSNYITDENGNLQDIGTWKLVEEDIYGAAASEDEDVERINHYMLEFLVCNGSAEQSHGTVDQKASLALFTTVGVQQSEDLTVFLTDGENIYTAVPTQIQEGMMWYETFGPGWMYRFYNNAGEELSWPLPGNIWARRELALTVVGKSEAVTALRLVAFAQQGLLVD